MAAAILAPRFRLAHNAAGANLASGVASALIAARDAELGLFEVDEAALPELAAALEPRVICLGNLFRDQLDRYGELEIVAERWRAMVARAAAPRRCSSSTPTIRWSRISPGRTPTRRRSASTIPPARRDASARGRLEVLRALRGAVRVRSRVRRAPRRLPVPGVRPLAAAAGRRGALGGAARHRGRLVRSLHARRAPRACACRCRVSTTSTTHSPRPRLRVASGCRLDEIANGLARASAAFGRFERIAIDGKSLVVLLVKNPAGANETLRTLMQGDDGRRSPSSL